MIITTKTPAILINLMNLYKGLYNSDREYTRLKACIYHNNTPVNVLQAVKTLKDINSLVNTNMAHAVDYELALRYLSDVTGYSPIELSERVELDT